jgi:hypothetical protein
MKAFHSGEICFRENSSGKLHTFGIVSDGTSWILRSSKLTTSTSFSLDYRTQRIEQFYGWLRIQDDGSNRICEWSMDGQKWVQFHSIGRTDFLTADKIGFACGAENSATPNFDVAMRVYHWKES